MTQGFIRILPSVYLCLAVGLPEANSQCYLSGRQLGFKTSLKSTWWHVDPLPSTERELHRAASGTFLSQKSSCTRTYVLRAYVEKATNRLSAIRGCLRPLLLNGGSVLPGGFLSLERQNILFQIHSMKRNILFPRDPGYPTPHITEPCSNPHATLPPSLTLLYERGSHHSVVLQLFSLPIHSLKLTYVTFSPSNCADYFFSSDGFPSCLKMI